MDLLIRYKEDAALMKRLATICRDVPFGFELPGVAYPAVDFESIGSDWYRWN